MDQKIRKKVLRKLIYGIYILAAKYEQEYSAATITWLSQASFEPPLIMLGLKKTSKTNSMVKKSGKFSINILNSSQKKMAAAFFKDTKIEDQKLNGYQFKISQFGNPVFENINAYIECEKHKLIEAGDHDIILAKVINVHEISDESVLDLKATGWNYGG